MDLLRTGSPHAVGNERWRPVRHCCGFALQLRRDLFNARVKGVQVRADERKRETEQTSCDLTRALLRVALEVDLAFPKDEHDVAAGSRTRKLVREEVGPAGAYAVTHIMEGGDELPRKLGGCVDLRCERCFEASRRFGHRGEIERKCCCRGGREPFLPFELFARGRE